MILKFFDLQKKLKKDINFFLLYGSNSGLIEETINNVLKPNLSNNIFYYEENEVLININEFREGIVNKSFFDSSKLIIISRASDKILNLIQEIIEKKIDDLKIIIKSDILEKKSKLRKFFETSNSTIIVPFYEDNYQSLVIFAQNFLKQKKIKISPQIINFVIERSGGSRLQLKNELEKIENFSINRKSVDLKEIQKLTNQGENLNISELTNYTLAKNKKKTLNILNENTTSIEDNIIILKNFLYKLKRLKKLKEDLKNNKNTDTVLSLYKPPIFWKEKDIIKQQLKLWSYNELLIVIKKVNTLENLIKKNSQISNLILNNFIIENLSETNN